LIEACQPPPILPTFFAGRARFHDPRFQPPRQLASFSPAAGGCKDNRSVCEVNLSSFMRLITSFPLCLLVGGSHCRWPRVLDTTPSPPEIFLTSHLLRSNGFLFRRALLFFFRPAVEGERFRLKHTHRKRQRLSACMILNGLVTRALKYPSPTLRCSRNFWSAYLMPGIRPPWPQTLSSSLYPILPRYFRPSCTVHPDQRNVVRFFPTCRLFSPATPPHTVPHEPLQIILSTILILFSCMSQCF